MRLTQFLLGYKPCMYVSPLLLPDEASYFQTIIGVMRWMVELGIIYIAVEVSELSYFLFMPRQEHMVNALHIMPYLKIKHNSRFVLDPSYPGVNMFEFKSNENWAPFYGDVQESKPLNAPKPLGNEVTLLMFVDSDHAGDKSDRRSRTGFTIFIHMAMINWHIKKQSTDEGAVFGAEFLAMKQGVEYLRGMKFKLQMMGVKIDSPTYIYGDNMSDIYNTYQTDSLLKKKSNSICYHFVR